MDFRDFFLMILALLAGFLSGYLCRMLRQTEKDCREAAQAVKAAEEDRETKLRREEDERAFQQLINYSAEQVYEGRG